MEILQRPVAESAREEQGRSTRKARKLQRPVADFGRPPGSPNVTAWRHNVILPQKVADRDARLRYAGKAIMHGWSRDVLAHDDVAACLRYAGEMLRAEKVYPLATV